jgi:DNA-binding CsgD family transcriptional regulator
MHVELDVHSYLRDLEKHLRLTLFGGGIADPEGAVLLVRGALNDGDRDRAAELAEQTRRLATIAPGEPDMAAAADHARALIDHDPAALHRAAQSYATALARARALEDAGKAWAGRDDQGQATPLLRQAYALYEEVGDDDDLARVRSGLRAAGTRLRHWTHADRPAFGWDSLTDTERRVAGLVAEGLSNPQVANQMFLSIHTVAFHLRHIFWKLGITSRVQLARIAAERSVDASDAPNGHSTADGRRSRTPFPRRPSPPRAGTSGCGGRRSRGWRRRTGGNS